MMRIWIKLLIISFLVSLISGCSVVKENSFDLESIEDRADGYYIVKQDKCYPLLRSNTFPLKISVFNNLFLEEDSYYYFLHEEFEKIPHLEESDRIILKSSNEITEKIPIVRMEEYLDTIGIILENGQSGEGFNISIPNGILLESKAKKEILESFNSFSDIKVMRISDQALSDDLLDDNGLIKNLKIGLKYKLSFLQGTKQKDIMITSDIKVLKSSVESRNFIQEKQYSESCFVDLILPSDIKRGYYLISGDKKEFRGVFFLDL